ncbi:MAG: hypothetical protein SH808_05470 [Saprospiraceae bacterium]|nr:hypothetical protein [Saprospiraceae bacterium]
MKNYLLFSTAILLSIGCKPKIDFMLVSPAEFCGCTDARIEYLVTNATSGQITSVPPVSDLSVVVLDNRTTATFHICETTNFTLTAFNENGEISSSGVSTLINPLPPYAMAMEPCLSGSGSWVSFTDILHPAVTNSEIVTLEFIADRPGTLTYDRLSVPVIMGRNVFSNFEGLRINNVFEFHASLFPNETCADPSTAPDGRARPPTLRITMAMRCRSGV